MNFINQPTLINCYEVLLIHFLCISVILRGGLTISPMI